MNEAVNVVSRLTNQLTDHGFVPSRPEGTVNEDITVTLVDVGTRSHSFSIDELGVHVGDAPGKSSTLTIEAPSWLGHDT